MPLPWLDPQHIEFPDTSQALAEPNGLLAAGGALTTAWLEAAYRRGIFPWYEEGQPILWWTPDPRLVLPPGEIHVSRSLKKLLRRQPYRVTLDTAFAAVVSACAAPRPDSPGTWITGAMQRAYCGLHRQGLAHSVEVWSDSTLVGGAYGVALGKMYFGESMFSHRDNTSKIALVYLCKQLHAWGFDLIDCQVRSEHLLSLGAFEISRREFETRLTELTALDPVPGQWQLDPQLDVIGHAIE